MCFVRDGIWVRCGVGVWCGVCVGCGVGMCGRCGDERAIDVESFGGFRIVPNQGVLAEGLETGFSVDIDQHDAPESMPVDICDIIDHTEDI